MAWEKGGDGKNTENPSRLSILLTALSRHVPLTPYPLLPTPFGRDTEWHGSEERSETWRVWAAREPEEGGTTDLTTQETDMPFITHSTRPPAGTALRRRKVDEENGKGTAHLRTVNAWSG